MILQEIVRCTQSQMPAARVRSLIQTGATYSTTGTGVSGKSVIEIVIPVERWEVSVVCVRAVAAQVAASSGGSCLLQYSSTSSYNVYAYVVVMCRLTELVVSRSCSRFATCQAAHWNAENDVQQLPNTGNAAWS